jgi:virginiamycin B lyase
VKVIYSSRDGPEFGSRGLYQRFSFFAYSAMSKLDAVRHSVSSLAIDAKIDIAGFPDWVGIDDANGAVWISNRDRDNVARIAVATNGVTAEVPVGKSPCSGLAIGHDSVWVPCCRGREIVRVDCRTNKVLAEIQMSIASSEGGITANKHAVWMPIDGGTQLAKIDPAQNKITATIAIESGSFTAAAGLGAIWVTSSTNNLVTRIDPSTNGVVATIAVGAKPRFLAVGFGSVWVLNQHDGTISRVDPSTNRVSITIDAEVPGDGGDISVGEGSVWITNLGTPLSRIDPVTNRVTAQFVGSGGDALRVGFGALWLCSFGLQQVWRIDPSKI